MLIYEDKYYSSDGGVWKIAKRLGKYAILEGYNGDKRIVLLVEGLTFEGTKLRWSKQSAFQSIEQAELEITKRTAQRKASEKALHNTFTQHTTMRKSYKGRKIKV